MLISVSGGWKELKQRNELDIGIDILGDDPTEVEHLQSLLNDKWAVADLNFSDGELTLSVKATRKVTLAEQAAAEAKAAADAQAAADKAAADAAAKAAAEIAAAKVKADADFAHAIASDLAKQMKTK